MLTLYYAPASSSMAVHIALHEVGAPFEARPMLLAHNDTRTPEFLAINPAGQVPVLMIDGRPLTEVAGILFYLARRYPEAKLLPDDIEAQAQAVSWMSYLAATVHPARKQGGDHALAVWSTAEARLGARTWVLDDYSVADIHLFRLFWRFSGSIDLPAGSFPNLSAHQDRVMARPAVQKTLADEAAANAQLTA